MHRLTFIVNSQYPLSPDCTCRIEIATMTRLRGIMRMRIIENLNMLMHAGY